MTVFSRERSRSRPGCSPALRQAMRKRGGHADVRRARLGGEAPLQPEVRPRRVAVDEHDRGAQHAGTDTSAFHIIHAVVVNCSSRFSGPDVPLQAVRLEVLDEQVAVPVDDRLGQAGRARREQHDERVVERHLLELERPLVGEQVGPLDRVGDRRLAVGHVHDVLDGGQRRADLRDLLRPVEVAVAEAVAADGEQDLRLDLREAVDDAARAELRRARRPGRAEARGGDERDDGLRRVGQVADDAVARSDAEVQQPPPGSGRPARAAPRTSATRLARLRARDDRDAVVVLARAEHVLARSSAASS